MILFGKTNFSFYYLLYGLFLAEVKSFILFSSVIIKCLECFRQHYLFLLLNGYCRRLFLTLFLWNFIDFWLLIVLMSLILGDLVQFYAILMSIAKIKVIIWYRGIIKGYFQVHRCNHKSAEFLHAETGIVKAWYYDINLNFREVSKFNLIKVIHHKEKILLTILLHYLFTFFYRFLTKLGPYIWDQQSKSFMFYKLTYLY